MCVEGLVVLVMCGFYYVVVVVCISLVLLV